MTFVRLSFSVMYTLKHMFVTNIQFIQDRITDLSFRLIWVDNGRITSMKLDGTELKILPVSARLPELVLVYKVSSIDIIV